ncbi:MAG: hypothetical protein WAT68_06395 [Candidatus Nitrotoga sp.]
MLNELYDLSLSLERAGVVPAEWHPDLKELPKVSKVKPCFKVYLAQDGAIIEIESIEDSAQIESLRKWQSGGNGYSFPCFNVRPLFKIYAGSGAEAPEKKKFDDWLNGLKKTQVLSDDAATTLECYADNGNALWGVEDKKRVATCLDSIPSKLNAMLGEPPDEYRAMAVLIERCRKTTADNFFKQLGDLLKDRIRNYPSACDKYAGFLLHSGTNPPKNDIQLILELADGLSSFPLPAANPKIHRWLNQQLLTPICRSDELSGDVVSRKNADAFGFTSADWENKLAKVSVPLLGGVILRAMSSESPCQTRYRRISATSFVVGKEVRKRVKGALEWLTDDERKGKTWGDVSFARDDKEILLVYPSELPKAPIAAVAMFGGAPTNMATQSARFMDYAEDVVKALHTISRPLKEVEMRVFALRKIDLARTQISCNRQYSAERLIAAATEWQTSCGNVPLIEIRQWGKEKGAKPEWHLLKVPFPLEVIWCLNTPWPKAADDAKKRVREFSSSDGIALLLDEGVRLKPLLERALHAAIRNGGNLMIVMAHTQHQGDIHKVNGKYDKQKLLLPAILGLLLAKLECNKGDYMKTAPYLIGRMLSLADQIHYHYCQHVRKGGAPSQLIGNALMATALEEPEKALALYAQRILPYQAWAKTTGGEGAGLAKYFLSELGKVCSEVALVDVPSRCTDMDKAQMLLGYLAKTEKSDSTNTAQSPIKLGECHE